MEDFTFLERFGLLFAHHVQSLRLVKCRVLLIIGILKGDGRLELGAAVELVGIWRHIGNFLLSFVLADYLRAKNFFLKPVDSFVDIRSQAVLVIVVLGWYFGEVDERGFFVSCLAGRVFRDQRIPAFRFLIEPDDQQLPRLVFLISAVAFFLGLFRLVGVVGYVRIRDGVELTLNRLDLRDLAAVVVSVVNVDHLVIIPVSIGIDLAEPLRRNIIERALQTALGPHRLPTSAEELVVGSLNAAVEHGRKGIFLFEDHPFRREVFQLHFFRASLSLGYFVFCLVIIVLRIVLFRVLLLLQFYLRPILVEDTLLHGDWLLIDLFKFEWRLLFFGVHELISFINSIVFVGVRTISQPRNADGTATIRLLAPTLWLLPGFMQLDGLIIEVYYLRVLFLLGNRVVHRHALFGDLLSLDIVNFRCLLDELLL